MTQLHPSQIHHYSRLNLLCGATSWALLLVIVGLLSAGTLTRPPVLRSLLFGLAWGTALATGQVRKIAIDAERLDSDLEDLSLTAFQQFAFEAMRPGADAVPIDAEIVSTSDDTQDIPIYDLADIKKSPHIAIVGPTGAGKSELLKWLVGRYFQGASVRIYDCDARPQDWQPLPVIGRGGDFVGISGAMVEDLELLDQRCKDWGKGKAVGGEEIRVCEEFPALAGELADLAGGKTTVATSWLKRLTRRGRKYKIRVVLVSQDFLVQSLNISGEGEIRKNFAVIRLGSAALQEAALIKDKTASAAILQVLQRCDRPCLIDVAGRYFVANVPDLTHANQQFQPAPAIAPRNEPRSAEGDIRNQLEMLYQQGSSIQDADTEIISDSPQDSPKIDPGRAKRVTEMKKQGLSQTQILAIEWQVKPGDSQRYRDAVAEYRAIVGEV